MAQQNTGIGTNINPKNQQQTKDYQSNEKSNVYSIYGITAIFLQLLLQCDPNKNQDM